jgi:hypothetical protein
VPRKQPQGLRPQCSAAAVDVQRLPIVLRGSSSVARELDDLEGEWLTCQGRRFNRVSKHALCVKHVKPSPIATVDSLELVTAKLAGFVFAVFSHDILLAAVSW